MLALSPVAVFAQDKAQTLADIRAELDALMADFTSLKAELVQSAGAGTGAGGGDALQRMDAIEAELTRLTGARDRHPAWTYSDIRTRLYPAALAKAYPDRALSFADLTSIASTLHASPVMEDK